MKRGPTHHSRSGYPYRKAELVPVDHDITKTWYISFYAWDITLQQMVRKRVLKGEFAQIPDLAGRLEYAEKSIKEINDALWDDHHLESKPPPEVMGIDFRGYSLLQGIEFVIKHKRERAKIKETSVEKYGTVKTTMEDFMRYANIPQNYPLKRVNTAFIEKYMQYLQDVKKINNNTYNSRVGFLHSIFETLIKKDRKLFKGNNIVDDIDKLIGVPHKHAAFSNDQLKSLTEDMIQQSDSQLVLYCQFMYYTLARPSEIVNLKVGHIDIRRRRILFRVSKTAEEFVGINDRFYQIIMDSGVLSYPDTYYVFSNEMIANRNKHTRSETNTNVGRLDERSYEPGAHHVGKNYFYNKFAGYLEKLSLYQVNDNFSLYSLKHSGAIDLYLATRDIKLVQVQCRHKKMETTIKYLRDLGIFTDFQQLNQWNGPI